MYPALHLRADVRRLQALAPLPKAEKDIIVEIILYKRKPNHVMLVTIRRNMFIRAEMSASPTPYGRKAGEKGGRKVQQFKSSYWASIPKHEIEALARCLLPDIQAYFESEEGKREYAEWEAQQEQ